MTAPVVLPDGRKSDLPAGWDEPTQLPPGGIRIEDLPKGWVPSSQVKPGTKVVPPPSKPSSSMPQAPVAGGKSGVEPGRPASEPPPVVSAPRDEYEDVTDKPSQPSKPPSRWGG